MHLNSNDIFSQIGLVVSNQESSEENPHFYTVYLEIELSEGKNQLLQIRNYDDAHEVATDFCRKHKLNELAVQIVQNKIIEAKDKEERRIKESMRQKSKDSRNSFNKSSVSSRYRHNNKLKESLSKNKYISKQSQNKSILSSINSKNKTHNKSFYNQLPQPNSQLKQSPTRNKSIQNLNKKSQSKNKSKSNNKQAKQQNKKLSPRKEKPKKANPNIGNELYARAMVRIRTQQNERQRRKEEQLKRQSQQLTFKPKINAVSTKIVQFRKENGESPEKQKEKQNKKVALNQQRVSEEANQIRECTFKPQINRVSELISQNRNVYKDQFDHFTALYKQAGAKKEKLNAKIDESSDKMFQPKINIKSSEAIKETFQQRLERSIIRKKVLKEGNAQDEECTHQPKVGRAPKNGKSFNKSDSTNSWWNQLHTDKLKTSQAPVVPRVQQSSYIPIVSNSSNAYFENLVEKRTSEVFKVLDSDEDGLISPDNIAIEKLTKNQLIFLRPLFEEMDELEAYLDFTQFRKALTMLLSETDVHSRGQFLSQKPKKQERTTFAPEINKKSKQLAMTRIIPGVQIFDQLYQNGLKELQRKEYQNQKIREQQEQLEMEECSFKPMLNNTSKYYIDKVLGKKMSRAEENSFQK